MKRYFIKAGALWAKRDAQISSEDQECFGCGFTIRKSEFYICDRLEQTHPGFRNSFTVSAVQLLIKLSWHMNCAPITLAEVKQCLQSALEEDAKPEPTRIVKAKET